MKQFFGILLAIAAVAAAATFILRKANVPVEIREDFTCGD